MIGTLRLSVTLRASLPICINPSKMLRRELFVKASPSMSPLQRKIISKEKIRSIGLPIHPHLPLVEAEDEVQLRTEEEILRRLIALWAVAGTAMLRENPHFREYIIDNQLQRWLSKRELEFLLCATPGENQYIQFSWQLEALYFIAWCAGLIDCIEIPVQESSVKAIMHLFPEDKEAPNHLRTAIRVRTKSEVLDQADLLYRLHWAVRNSRLKGDATQLPVNPGVVQEWHRAVNWVIRYDQEDNWDYVATDT